MTEPDRGESYLEIQMDRSTIVLAALGILACMVVSFLLGSWTATRKAKADRDGAEIAQSADDAAAAAETEEQDVDSEPSFGGKPVSASGAPALTAIPPPAASPTETRPKGTSGTAPKGTSGTAPKGTSGITVATDTEDVAVEDVTPATSTKAPPPKPTPTTRKPAPAKATAPAPASGAESDGSWVVQVAAVKDRPEADALKKRLESKGYPVRILDEGGYLKVQVGPYPAKTEAQAAEQRLKREKGLATWVKKA